MRLGNDDTREVRDIAGDGDRSVPGDDAVHVITREAEAVEASVEEPDGVIETYRLVRLVADP